jgi:hypothetical protein
MKTTRSSIRVPEVPGYTELQQELHDALRAQHPEWIETDGKSPTCDYYESLFAALLVSHRAHARAHYNSLLNITETERLSATANASILFGYAETQSFTSRQVRSDDIVGARKALIAENQNDFFRMPETQTSRFAITTSRIGCEQQIRRFPSAGFY